MDYFLDDNNVIKRLIEEWEKYDGLIVAYDYDNTVYDYGNKGYSYNNVINLLRRLKKLDTTLIVFTCNTEDKYDVIKKYLNENDIPYDKINENADETMNFKGRKIYYNMLIDDRAGLSSAYNCLLKVVEEMEKRIG